MKIIEKCKELGEPVLVFTIFLSTLDYIQNALIESGKYTWERYEGKDSARSRERKITKFNKSETDVFVISMRAGSLGINLTAANRVVLFDVDWNPCYNTQAAARVLNIL